MEACARSEPRTHVPDARRAPARGPRASMPPRAAREGKGLRTDRVRSSGNLPNGVLGSGPLSPFPAALANDVLGSGPPSSFWRKENGWRCAGSSLPGRRCAGMLCEVCTYVEQVLRKLMRDGKLSEACGVCVAGMVLQILEDGKAATKPSKPMNKPKKGTKTRVMCKKAAAKLAKSHAKKITKQTTKHTVHGTASTKLE